MPHSIRQFGIAYNADQDRLLLSVIMADESEIRLWLTRRLTRGIFSKIVDSMHHRPELERIQQPEVKEVAINMSHQETVSKTQFVKRKASGARNLMSQTGPLVIKTGTITPQDNGGAILTFSALNGSNIGLVLHKQLLHSFCQLLIKKSEIAAWDLSLSVGDSTLISGAESNVH